MTRPKITRALSINYVIVSATSHDVLAGHMLDHMMSYTGTTARTCYVLISTYLRYDPLFDLSLILANAIHLQGKEVALQATPTTCVSFDTPAKLEMGEDLPHCAKPVSQIE